MRDSRPAPKGTNPLLLGLLIVVGALFAGGLLIYAVKASADRREARRAEDRARQDGERAREREEGRAEAAAAFAEPAAPAAADRAEFDAVFADLGAALARGDAPAVNRTFDPERMVREMDRIGAFDKLPDNMRSGFREGVRKGANERVGALLVDNELVRWARTDVRRVRWSADRSEVMVIAVHRNGEADDVPARIRWWLVKHPGGWKIYDYEDMHMSLRATRLIAAMATPDMIERMLRDLPRFQAGMAGVRDSIVFLSRNDVVSAEAAIAPARGLGWPDPIQAVVEFVEGAVRAGHGDAEGALARFDKAERLLPGMTALALARGAALVRLGRHAEALDAVRAYQKEIGPDALSCNLEGTALEGQGKKVEAAGAFRRALDEVADSTDALDGLRRALPADQKKELGDRLAKLKNPRKVYDELIHSARADGDTAGADALLDALLGANPDDPAALGDDVRRKVAAKKFDEAEKVLARGLKLDAPEDRTSVLNAYLFAMSDAEKALEAYAAVPAAHARNAFRLLADDMDDDDFDPADAPAPDRAKRLADLIAAHRKRAADDPWLWYYEGAIHQSAKEYEKAERAFAAGAGKLAAEPGAAEPDRLGDAARFRSRRVQCLFQLKKGPEAYKTVGPVNDTFRQLAHLYDGAKDLDGLEKLIAAHRDSGDVEATYWRAHLMYRRAEYGRSVLVYYKYLETSGENAPSRWSARDEVIRARLRADNPKGAADSIAEFGADSISAALRAAVAAATGDRAELVRVLEENTKNGAKTWFYGDEDFRRAIYQEKYRDLRTKFPDPNPPPKLDG